jgi:hypothetical protein
VPIVSAASLWNRFGADIAYRLCVEQLFLP